MKSIEIDRSKRLKEEPHRGHNRWHHDLTPVVEGEEGEEVVRETRDASDGQTTWDSTIEDMATMERGAVHPLTGPVYVKGAKPGDLYVEVHVEPHPVMRRTGDNLTMTLPVTFAEAALGTKVTVPTFEGPVTLKIPAGTESGQTLRVRGRGGPAGKNRKGDLLVTVQVVVPSSLTRTQKKLVEEFAAMDDTDPRAHLQDMIAQGGG